MMNNRSTSPTTPPFPGSPSQGFHLLYPEMEFIEEMTPDWLTIETLATLLGKTYMAVKKLFKRKYTIVKYIRSRGGSGGLRPVVHITDPAIPPEAQVRWVQMHKEYALNLPKEIFDRLSAEACLEIERLKQSQNMTPLPERVDEKMDKKVARDVELCIKALKVPPGMKATEWRKQVAQEAGITMQALYKKLKLYQEGGWRALAKKKGSEGARAWDEEALQFMQGIYLKMLREGGNDCKMRAYEAVLAEAEKRGWKVGSKSSAYEYLNKINPLLIQYATGGDKRLDNIFYIVRDYRDLSPLEILVGDQHRFNFFVQDEDGKVFRPEGYFWLDMRTRLCYGFAIADRYNSYFMGLALKMGLKAFGKPQVLYTDNGKPELSNYISGIVSALRKFEINTADIAELYRTDDGYVIEGEEGKIIEIVPTLQAWHRKARAYNAKAKPIERFFQTLEQIISGLGVPGQVKDLRKTAEEKDMVEARIKELVESGGLLSIDEFIQKVFEAVNIYNTRKHRSIGRAPLDEYIALYKAGEFSPVFIHESEVDFILLAKESRRVNRGRIWLNGAMYEGLSLEHGLWDVPDGTKVEIRFDP